MESVQVVAIVTDDNALLNAFIQGAKWWELHQTGATMWRSDQEAAAVEAERLLKRGMLGKHPDKVEKIK